MDAVTELSRLVNNKAYKCYAVIGESAETWQYNRKMSVAQCSLYDDHVERSRKGFEACGIPAITGAEELRGLKLGDSIGHVSLESESVVFAACVSWIIQARSWHGLGLCARSVFLTRK